MSFFADLHFDSQSSYITIAFLDIQAACSVIGFIEMDFRNDAVHANFLRRPRHTEGKITCLNSIEYFDISDKLRTFAQD